MKAIVEKVVSDIMAWLPAFLGGILFILVGLLAAWLTGLLQPLLIFSCVGRLSSLGPMVNSEIEGLAATWNKPMAGFFSLGEFGKLDDTPPEFHGTTVSWVVFKEK